MPKAKRNNLLTSPGMQEALGNARNTLLNSPSGVPSADSLSALPVTGVDDNLTLYRNKQALENKSGLSDYIGAMNRRDDFLDGSIAWMVGHTQFDPDPSWVPMAEANWKQLSDGIPEEYHDDLRKALQTSVNASHAQYIKDQFLQRMQDEELLNTLKGPGNIGRFAYGLVSPGQLLTTVATMGTSRVIQLARGAATLGEAGKALQVASKIEDPATRLAEMTKAKAALEDAYKAAGASRGVGLNTALGTAAGAAYGGAFEKLRQSVSFEDNKDSILDATLSSAAFAAPFAFLGASSMNRLAHTAAQERSVLGVMKKLNDGEALNEKDLGALKSYGAKLEQVQHEETTGDHTPSAPIQELQNLHDARAEALSKFDTSKPWEPTNDPLGGTPITVDHLAGDSDPLSPGQPFDKLWENQTAPIHENDFLQLEKDGEFLTGDVKKVGKDHVVLKTEDGKVKRVNPQDYLLSSHDPRADHKQLNPNEDVRAILADPLARGKADVVKGHQGELRGTPWADRLTSLLKQGKAAPVKTKEVLKSLSKRFDGTAYGPVIRSLMDNPGLNTRMFLARDSKEKTLGYYVGGKADTLVAHVDDLGRLSDPEAQTVIHELVHAHTQHALEGELDHVLSPAQKKAVADLKDLHKQVEAEVTKTHGITRGKGYKGAYYGLNDVHDFVAEALTNREFQKLLAEVKVGGYSALGKVWAGIKRILGIGKDLDETALAKAIGLSENLLSSRFQEPKEHLNGIDLGGKMSRRENVLPEREYSVPEGPTVLGSIQVGKKKLPIRWDISKVFDDSPNPLIRQLGFDLVKNPIGWNGGKAQGITISERKERIRRVVTGAAHFEMKEALTEAIQKSGMGLVGLVRSGFVKSFYENVTRVARGDMETLTKNRTIAPELQKAANALRKFYDTMAHRARDAGLRGAENLPSGGNYVNRVWLQSHIRDMAAEHGEEAVVALIATAFKNPKIKGDMEVARKFLGALKQLEFKTEVHDLPLNAGNLDQLREHLNSLGLSEDAIDALSRVMFDIEEQKAGDLEGGKPANLKHRMDIDENATITTPEGKTLSVSDLIENDARLLVDKYTNSMGGYIAAAEHGWADPEHDFNAHVRKIDKWASEESGASYDPKQHKADVELAQNIFNSILGRPWSDQGSGKLPRYLNALRAYTRSVFLGQLGIAAAFELKNAMALSAFHGAWSQMPTFGRIIQMLKKGIPVDDQLAKDVQHLLGFGNEFAMSYGREHEVSDFAYDHNLTWFEKFSEKASQVVDTISGNATFTSATRNLAAKMVVQHLYDIAAGSKSLDRGLEERLIHNGIDKANMKEVLQDINKHVISDTRGVVQQINWEEWADANRKTYDQFSLAIERFTRDAIQDHNIGETMPWMHTTLGKIIAELRTFNLVAHSKQFLKNVHYHDRMSAMVFMTSFVGECLAYSIQQAMNYAHNPDALQTKLTAERISKGAIQRMAPLGMLSYGIETPYQALTGRSFFQGGTTNTDNRDLLMTPSMMVLKRMMGGTQSAFQAISPISDKVTNQQDFKDGIGVLPGINTWGVRNIVDYAASHNFPKTDPNRFPHNLGTN